MMARISIRPYEERDREAVRDIAWQTAFMGRPADLFFTDKSLLQDFLTLYFTDYEPGSCFIADDGNGPVGYLLGACDERRVGMVAVKKFVPRLLARLLFKDMFDGKNRALAAGIIKSAIAGEFKGEDFYREYPAILHVNLRESHRGQGIGGSLISTYQDYLRFHRVPGVHLATMSAAGASFFSKQGFKLLACHRRSYFRHITGGDIEVSIFGKHL